MKVEVKTNTVGLMGSVLAMILSWTVNKSVLWMILHGMIGWIYVFYYLLTKGE